MPKLRLAMLLGFSALLVACSSGKTSMEDLKKLKEEGCACKDKACAEAVDKKVDKALANLDSSGDQSSMGGVLLEIGMCIAPLLEKN